MTASPPHRTRHRQLTLPRFPRQVGWWSGAEQRSDGSSRPPGSSTSSSSTWRWAPDDACSKTPVLGVAPASGAERYPRDRPPDARPWPPTQLAGGLIDAADRPSSSRRDQAFTRIDRSDQGWAHGSAAAEDPTTFAAPCEMSRRCRADGSASGHPCKRDSGASCHVDERFSALARGCPQVTGRAAVRR